LKILKALECFEFGRIAFVRNDFYNTIRWMNEALAQAELEGVNATVPLVQILDYLIEANAQVI
jgi:hypothetical protein